MCVMGEPASGSSACIPGGGLEEYKDSLGKLNGKKSGIPAYGIFSPDPLGPQPLSHQVCSASDQGP